MEWKKRKIVINVWETNEFKITEDVDGEDRPFRLDSPYSDPEYFTSLELAKSVAKMQNELVITKEELERLRTELDELRRGDDFERRAADFPEEPVDVDAIAAELIEVMAANDAADHVAASDAPDPWFDSKDDGRGVPTRPAVRIAKSGQILVNNRLPLVNAGPNDQPF